MNPSNRRKFIGTAAALGVATAGAAVLSPALYANTAPPASGNAKRPSLIHHAIFWLKNPQSTADRDKLVEGVKTLAHVKTIKELHVGILAATEKRDVVDTSWQVSEIMFFDNIADQAAYQNDPIHLDFVKNYSHLWEKVIVYDAMEA